MDLKRLVRIKNRNKKKKPSFSRQEKQVKKLKKGWRRPKGRHSKLRQKEKARGRHPSPGYGSPRLARGLSRSGLKEIRISNPTQVAKIDTKTEAALIAGTVGKAKREKIIEQAKKLGVKVVNA